MFSKYYDPAFLPSQFLKSMTPQLCSGLWWTVGRETLCWWGDWAFLVQLHFWWVEDIPAKKNNKLNGLIVLLNTENALWQAKEKHCGLTGRLQGFPFTFTQRFGGKWSSWGQLVSDKQNLKMQKTNCIEAKFRCWGTNGKQFVSVQLPLWQKGWLSFFLSCLF